MPNGTIRTEHALDRETIPVYNLVVTARDCAKEPEKRLSSTVQVKAAFDDIYAMAFYFFQSIRINQWTGGTSKIYNNVLFAENFFCN